MQDLLFVPFRKLMAYRGFWIFFLLSLSLTFLGTWTVSQIDLVHFGLKELGAKNFMSFPQIWILSPWLLKLTGYFLSSIVILLVCHDLENGLLKQHLLDGWSRERALASYSSLCAAFSVVILLLLIVIGFVFGIDSGKPYFSQRSIEAIAGFTLQSFLTFQFALLLSLVFKRAVICVVAFLSWQLLCEPIIRALLVKFHLGSLLDFLPFAVIDRLMPSLRSLVPQSLDMGLSRQIGHSSTPIMGGLAYLFVFWGLSWLVLKKQD